jgi:carboxylesterase type B
MRAIGLLLMALLTITPSYTWAQDLRVVVDAGTLVGLSSRDGVVRSFKGVPYAAPPVGPLRWRAHMLLLCRSELHADWKRPTQIEEDPPKVR